MYNLRRLTVFVISVGVFIVLASLLPRLLNPSIPTSEERKRDKDWVDTSPYWVDRQICRWFSLCGVHHVRWDPPDRPDGSPEDDRDDLRLTELRRRALWPVDEAQQRSWEDAGDPTTAASGDGGGRRAGKERDGVKILQEIPDYVLDYAPLVHLYSGENFWPADIANHVQHMMPYINGSELNISDPLSLGSLQNLNAEGEFMFLTSQDDVEERPEWLHSRMGMPVPFEDDDEDDGEGRWGGQPGGGGQGSGEVRPPRKGTTWWDVDKKHPPHRIADPTRTPSRPPLPHRRSLIPEDQKPLVAYPSTHKAGRAGFSEAPAVLVLVDKGSDILDAFWFFFYSYNLGQTVLTIRFGNHVGDWEHCMVRFEHGIPRAMFLSEHEGGKALAWEALEKKRLKGSKTERPVIYSAVGSHAMYAFPGQHPYVLPFGMLADVTDRGPLWDPSLNTYAYFYDYEAAKHEDPTDVDNELKSLTPAASNPDAPTSWFHFGGQWGDDIYGLGDSRQWRLFGQYHYTDGPTGPKLKNLTRRKVCQTERCTILYSLAADKKSAWYS